MKIQDALRTKLSSYYAFLKRMDILGYYIDRTNISEVAWYVNMPDSLLDTWAEEWRSATSNDRSFSKNDILYLHNIRGISSNFVRNNRGRDEGGDGDENTIIGIDDIPPLPADH